MKKYIITLLFILGIHFIALSQQEKIPITEQDYDNNQITMADQMRESGKIWVVVGTISVVVGGLFLYLFMLEKRVAKIEKLTNSER